MLVTVVVAGVAAFAGGCGGSSKPAYCSDLKTLQKSINSLSPSGGVSSLESQLKKIQSEAQTLVSSAKGHYGPQSEAVKTAFNKLSTSVKSISGTPTASQLSDVVTSAEAAVTAVNDLATATKGACK
jgi:outer membrane murein-binding lipoprotein Lpp